MIRYYGLQDQKFLTNQAVGYQLFQFCWYPVI